MRFLLIFLFFVSTAQAQEPIFDTLPPDDNLKSLVRLDLKLESIDSLELRASGSAVLIKKTEIPHPALDYLVEGYLLTCLHCCDNVNYITAHFKGGALYGPFQIVARSSKQHDVAIIKGYVKKTLPSLSIAKELPKRGDLLKLAGWAYGKNLEYYKAPLKRAMQSGEFIYVDEDVYPGQSGGFVLNADNEVVGVIQGGQKWFSKTGEKPYTWPTRIGSLGIIHKLMKEIE